MRALTLHQPYASLVAVGAKTIETRGHRTSYRGPLLIHAGLARPPMMWLPPLSRERGDEARERDRQTWHVIDTITAPEHQRPHITDRDHPMRDHVPKWATSPTLFFPSAGSFARPGRPDGVPATEFGSAMVLPLGAVVASCQLAGCVPIGPPFDREGVGDPYDCAFIQKNGKLYVYRGLDPEDETDQLPFGDFSPGRYAWLLDDVKPTTERCPQCWNSGWISYENGEHDRCPICAAPFGPWGCAPVPMRGRQGLWTPTEDDWLKAAA